MPPQFDEVSWHVESYLITTNIAIILYHFSKCTVFFVSVLLCFSDAKKIFFVPLFRGKQLTRRPYGHFAAFLRFREFFLLLLYIGIIFVLKHKTNKLN